MIPNPNKPAVSIKEAALFKRFIGDAHQLEKNGFKVRVEVLRLRAADGMKLRQKRPNGYLTAKLSVPFYQLRKEREQECKAAAAEAIMHANAATQGVVSQADIQEKYNQLMRENYLSPFGGLTRVTITTSGGFDFVGISQCHIEDIFNRRTASKKAFSAAYNAMIEATDWEIAEPKKLVNELLSQTAVEVK